MRSAAALVTVTVQRAALVADVGHDGRGDHARIGRLRQAPG